MLPVIVINIDELLEMQTCGNKIVILTSLNELNSKSRSKGAIFLSSDFQRNGDYFNF